MVIISTTSTHMCAGVMFHNHHLFYFNLPTAKHFSNRISKSVSIGGASTFASYSKQSVRPAAPPWCILCYFFVLNVQESKVSLLSSPKSKKSATQAIDSHWKYLRQRVWASGSAGRPECHGYRNSTPPLSVSQFCEGGGTVAVRRRTIVESQLWSPLKTVMSFVIIRPPCAFTLKRLSSPVTSALGFDSLHLAAYAFTSA